MRCVVCGRQLCRLCSVRVEAFKTPSATATTRNGAKLSLRQHVGPVDGRVTPTYPGLIMKDIVDGSGKASASSGDIVTVKYSGRLKSSGKEFDAGVYTFKLGVGRVIKGWDEGLKDMKIGSKRTLEISPELAYGRSGVGGAIPPNATLEFDTELIAISNGPVAEIKAALGIGKNPRTGLLLALITLILYLVDGLSFPDAG